MQQKTRIELQNRKAKERKERNRGLCKDITNGDRKDEEKNASDKMQFMRVRNTDKGNMLDDCKKHFQAGNRRVEGRRRQLSDKYI